MLASACASTGGAKPEGRIMIVGALGVPVQGAIVVPDSSDDMTGDQGAGRRLPSQGEIDARTSDAQGIIHADLDQYLWDSDGCYHFRIRRFGFEDVTMAVSRDLFPQMLTINLGAKTQTQGPHPADPASAPGVPPAGQESRQP